MKIVLFACIVVCTLLYYSILLGYKRNKNKNYINGRERGDLPIANPHFPTTI